MSDALKTILNKLSPTEILALFERYRRENRDRRRARRHEREYQYYKELPPDQFPDALKKWYKKHSGKRLNLENPRTFNEKIQWMKIHDYSPLKTRLADKYLVREWVAGKIGEEYLIPLLGVYDRFDDIDFEALPKKFVIKTNHDSVTKRIVTDKSKFDIAGAKKYFDHEMRINVAFSSWLEPYYRDIVPKIIIEQYLENSEDELHDYKFWCFGGKVKFISIQTEWQSGLKTSVFDTQGKRLPFKFSRHESEKEVEKPDNLEEMIKLAETLAEGFLHVRVDFFRLNDGTIKFGEMLFSPESGMCEWDPPEYDKIIGDLLELPIDKK